MTKLNLKRPMVMIDIEATGVNVATDRIVEIAMLKIMPDGKQETRVERVNPSIPIPPESTKIHGITDEDIKDAPKFKEIAQDIAGYLEGCDLGGFNSSSYDIPLLAEEFLRVQMPFDTEGRNLVDVQHIFHKMEPRNLEAAYAFYCNKPLKNAHTAKADIEATYEVLLAQLERYQGTVENDVAFLHRFSKRNDKVDFAGRMVYDKDGRERFNFGKHKGKLVEKVLREEPQYYDWIMKKDFARDTKRKLTAIRLRHIKHA